MCRGAASRVSGTNDYVRCDVILVHTTKSESLRAGRETLKARHWGLWNWREARGILLNMKGTSFEAMVVVLRNEAMEYVEDVNDGAQSDSLGSAKTSTNEMRRVSHLPKRDFTFSRHCHLQDYIQT